MAVQKSEERMGWAPIPDPTALTDAAIARSDKAMRDWVEGQLEIRDERLKGLDKLTDERFNSVKEAVASALVSQKEAIGKSEIATTDTIAKLTQLFQTTVSGLGEKVDDIKERVGRIESVKQGATENRTGLYAGIAAVGGVLAIVLIIAAALATRSA